MNHLQEISSLEDIKEESVPSFFLPKLKEDELKLVEEKNKEYSSTFSFNNFDVSEDEMKKSDSTDKYLQAQCHRWTMILNLDDTSSESSSENSTEMLSEMLSEYSNETSSKSLFEAFIGPPSKKSREHFS